MRHRKSGCSASLLSFHFHSELHAVIAFCNTGDAFNGTYTYDSSASTLNLKFSGLVGMDAAVSGSSNTMSLLFDADKLLQLVTFLGNKVNNASFNCAFS